MLIGIREPVLNGISISMDKIEEKASSLLVTESRLRRALRHDEFFLVYQPIFNLLTRRITGVEALIRWQQPDGSCLLPSFFIPLAEKTGLIVPIGEWVLRTACQETMGFIRKLSAPLSLAVNLSPRQLREASLLENIAQVLNETGFDPNLLELEITEGILLDQGFATENAIRRLREMGIKIVLDDFGSGYSGLGYLRRFPIDRLKIDRSFVADIEKDLPLTSAVIQLGQNLKVQVTAEGVETPEQWQFLLEHGCDDAQGYHLAMPMPAEELLDYLTGKWFTA
jgi:diguanylate cyclase